MRIDFNDNWIFYKKGSESEKLTVTLPHDAMIKEKRSGLVSGGKNTGWFEGCDYIYEKEIILDKSDEDKKIIIEFEGVYRNAEVFLNDKQIAFRPYGYTNFYVELTPHLIFGQNNVKEDEMRQRADEKLMVHQTFADEGVPMGTNILKVSVKNSDQPNSRWYSGAGIYRNVNLYKLNKKHIELNGIKIKTLEIDTPKIEVLIDTSDKGTAILEVLDGDTILFNQQILSDGKAKAVIDLPGAKCWSIDNPKLYTLKVNFEEDIQQIRFGIRKTECNAKDGFVLNGERVILRGACIHHDNGLLGSIAHPFAEKRKIELLKKAGYNAIRSAHNPCSKALLDACDELGMFVMDEYVDMWYIHKTKYDYAKYFEEWWKQDLADLVNKDYNHPSVIMYSIGNEVAETAQSKGIALAGEMTDYLHKLDGGRFVTCGINLFFNYLSSMGFGVYSNKKAAKKVKVQKEEKEKPIGSEFFNMLAGIFGDKTMKIGATLKGSDRKTRDTFSKLDVAGYNYGILRHKKDVKKYPGRVMVGSETFVKDAYYFMEFAKKHPALIGDFVWTGMDYIGEVGLGAWEYRDYAKEFVHGSGWLTAGCGVLDITGNGDGQSLYVGVAFELDKIRIGVVPANNALNKHSASAWRMTNTRESWSWQGCDGNKTIVEVYARAAKVVLFINGRKAGQKKSKKDCKFKFKVRYIPGKITAVAYDKNNMELYRTSLQSAGQTTVLKAIPEKETVSKNDLSYVRLKFTDENGILKPLARGDISVKVEDGTLLALGNACPYNEKGYLNSVTDTHYGEALAIIKPDGEKDIKIFADSPYGNADVKILVN